MGNGRRSEVTDVSEHSPDFGSEYTNPESEANGSWRANGAVAGDAVAVVDVSAADAVATNGEPADAAAAVEPDGEATASANAVVATATTAESGHVDEGDATSADDGSAFLAELARAMQTTAGVERARIADQTERRRNAHIAQIRARQESEAARMRELHDEDLKAIDAWADGEQKRIQEERERRATGLAQDLETSLAEHVSKIDREIDGVETAIKAYRADVDTFFAGLDRETDPVLIAQQAAKRPIFPALDAVTEVGAVSAADAAEAEPPNKGDAPGPDEWTIAGTTSATEPVVVGVMDPGAGAEPAESWAASPDTSPEPVPAEPPESPVATASAPQEAGSGILQSVHVHRPMSWLRRDANGGGNANGET
jgi:hypothetical protein